MMELWMISKGMAVGSKVWGLLSSSMILMILIFFVVKEAIIVLLPAVFDFLHQIVL
jgi:hypothetical protein